MLTAACVCPHPPLLLPALAGASDVLAEVRAASLESVRRLGSSGASTVVAVGPGSAPGEWDARAGGSTAGFGVPAAYGGDHHVLPLSLTVAGFLLDATGWGGERRYLALSPDADGPDLRRLGEHLVQEGDVAVLAMADGSARRSLTAPGYLDDRAEAFDAAVNRALIDADADALAALDTETARALWAGGLPVWRLLGGIAAAIARSAAGIDARVRYDDAPLGVGYLVLDWTVRSAGTRSGNDSVPRSRS